MGMLEDMVGKALGSATEGQQGGMLDSVMGLINSPEVGGLNGLLQKFQSSGFAEHAASWVGNGENLPVTGEQIQQVLGSGQIGQLAQQLGLPEGEAAGGLATLLPQVINHLTPNGQVEGNQDLGSEAMNLLKSKLFG